MKTIQYLSLVVLFLKHLVDNFSHSLFDCWVHCHPLYFHEIVRLAVCPYPFFYIFNFRRISSLLPPNNSIDFFKRIVVIICIKNRRLYAFFNSLLADFIISPIRPTSSAVFLPFSLIMLRGEENLPLTFSVQVVV